MRMAQMGVQRSSRAQTGCAGRREPAFRSVVRNNGRKSRVVVIALEWTFSLGDAAPQLSPQQKKLLAKNSFSLELCERIQWR